LDIVFSVSNRRLRVTAADALRFFLRLTEPSVFTLAVLFYNPATRAMR
jgi:hypothetical protein